MRSRIGILASSAAVLLFAALVVILIVRSTNVPKSLSSHETRPDIGRTDQDGRVPMPEVLGRNAASRPSPSRNRRRGRPPLMNSRLAWTIAPLADARAVVSEPSLPSENVTQTPVATFGAPLLFVESPAAVSQRHPFGLSAPGEFSSFLYDLGDAIRRLPAMDAALLLSGGGVVGLSFRGQDRAILRQRVSSPTLDSLFGPGDAMGGVPVQAGAALAIYATGRVMNSPKTIAVGADLMQAQILNGALTRGLKMSVRRTRPGGGHFSFPSGHTSSSFATATVLGRHFGWRVGAPATALAAYVGASRLQQKRHFPSDVVFGAAVGIVAGRAVTLGRTPTRFVVAPMASARGVGVELVWVRPEQRARNHRHNVSWNAMIPALTTGVQSAGATGPK